MRATTSQLRDSLRPILGLALRSSDENARNENERSAKSYLHGGGEDGRVHEPVSHPCDDPEFDQNDDNGDPQGKLKLVDQEREGMANASQRRHSAAN